MWSCGCWRGYDAAAQRAAMDALNDCAAMVIQPINAPEIREGIAALAGRGIPVITINTDLADSRRTLYVGADYYRGGLTAGGMVNLCCESGARLGIVAGSAGHPGPRAKAAGLSGRIGPPASDSGAYGRRR